MPPNFTANSHGFVTGCRKLYFSSVECRNPKKGNTGVGDHSGMTKARVNR